MLNSSELGCARTRRWLNYQWIEGWLLTVKDSCCVFSVSTGGQLFSIFSWTQSGIISSFDVYFVCVLYVYIYIYSSIYIYTRKSRRKSAIIMPNAIVSEKEIALALASFGLFRGSCCIQSIWGMRLAFQKLQHWSKKKMYRFFWNNGDLQYDFLTVI